MLRSLRFLPLLLVPTAAFGQAALTPKQVYERCRDSVVSIEVETDKGEATGTGFFYENGRTVATALHVLHGAKRITIRARGGDAWVPLGVTIDGNADLALLRLGADSGRKPILHAPSYSVGVGDPVYVIGDPLGLTGSLSTGVVGALRSDDGVPLVQITAPVSHGSSGGPVLDAQGRAVGVVSFMMTEGQNVNMAVSTKVAKNLLDAKDAVTLTLTELESFFVDVDKDLAKKGDKGATAAPSTEKEKAARDEARGWMGALLGRVYGDLCAAEMRWDWEWEASLSRFDSGVDGRLAAAKEKMEDALVIEKEVKDLIKFGLAAGASTDELRSIADRFETLAATCEANFQAQREVNAAAHANDQPRLDRANKAMQAKDGALRNAVIEFGDFPEDQPWCDRDAYYAAISAPVKASWILFRFHAQPDLDLPGVPFIRGKGNWAEGALRSGDRILNVAVDDAAPTYVSVNDWDDFWNFCVSHLGKETHFLLKVRRAGKEVVVRELATP